MYSGVSTRAFNPFDIISHVRGYICLYYIGWQDYRWAGLRVGLPSITRDGHHTLLYILCIVLYVCKEYREDADNTANYEKPLRTA